MTPHSCEPSAAIYLDYGADSAAFDFEDLHICPQGMRLRTRWQFAPGTELSVNFQLSACPGAPGSRDRLLKTEGIVVECEADEARGGGYVATVIFLEVTDDILAVIRDVMPAAAA